MTHAHFQNIVISVDVVLFSIIDNKLSVFLVYRDHEPYNWFWALPWAPMRPHEELEITVARMLFEKTWLKRVYTHQFAVFDGLDRDPRWRTVSISYLSIMKQVQQEKGSLVALFFPLRSIPDLAFDHKEIVLRAYDKLKANLESGMIVNFLDKRFTLTELQRVHECIYGYAMDVRNFRKKILSSGLISAVPWEKRKHTIKRPAQLYRFVNNYG